MDTSLQLISTSVSYLKKVSLEPLKQITIGSAFEEAAKRYKDLDAVISRANNHRMTYEKLLEQSDKLAAGFQMVGLEKGDRVGLWAPNMVEWVVTKIAIARAGLIMVPMNPISVASEVKYYINKVELKAVVCPDAAKHINYYEILNEIDPSIRNSEAGNLNCKKIPSLRIIIAISNKFLKGTYNYYFLLHLADQKRVAAIRSIQHTIQPTDPCCIQFSSGTTGKPKPAVQTHLASVNNAYFVGKRLEFDGMRHIACVQNPFFHVYGDTTILGCLLHFEMTIVIPSTFYSPVENLKAIHEERCNLIFGTPTMYIDLITVQKKNNFCIYPGVAVTGGAPCSPVIFNQMKDVLNVKTIKSTYGLTQATSGVFISLPKENEYNTLTYVGHIVDHLEVKVVDANNTIVPFGTPGELCIRGFSNILGYWNDEEETNKAIDKDKWLRTGDQFILYNDGYAKIVGRLKEVIIRGGENIYPKEIEDIINTHPSVKETCVIGLPHARLGEEVCACVRLVEGATISLDTLKEYLEGRLSKYKIPTALKVVDNFPKTQSGKVQKYILRQQFIQE